MNVRQQQPNNMENDLSPQERQDVRSQVRMRNELLDDVPAQFKRTRGAAYYNNGFLCEVFAAERS